MNSLAAFFQPASVAVIGASNRESSVGYQVFKNLRAGGFQGALFPVHPRDARVQGVEAYPTLAAIGATVELAVIATRAETVADLLRQCSAQRVGAALVLTAGFGERGDAGNKLQQQLVDISRAGGVRILGPNCLGIISTQSKLNATFSRGSARPGDVALVSQSGALCTAILDWAEPRGVGFSHLVSLGDAADVDFGEVLDYLALDPGTKSILLYVEGIRHARRFMSGLRAASRLKPVLVLKAGRSDLGARVASSHTGALASSDAAFTAALERAGAVRIGSIGQLFAGAEMLAAGYRTRGQRLAIVSNAGGPAVMATDKAAELGVSLAALGDATLLGLSSVLPEHWSHKNPVDLLGDATAERYRAALDLVSADPEVDGILTILTPQAMTEPDAVADAVIDTAATLGKPVVACWMGQQSVSEAWKRFAERRVPNFRTPEAAVEAFSVLCQYRRAQRQLLEVPGPLAFQTPPDVRGARLIIEQALAEQRQWLTALEARALLSAFKVPVLPAIKVHSAGEALAAAETLGLPVVLKIESPDIVHKSDVEGVELNIASPEAVRSAYTRLLARVKQRAPDARIDGVLCEPMFTQAGARQLLVGLKRDASLGPIIAFGSGGVAVEVLGDVAVGLPPLNLVLAGQLIAKTRARVLLSEYRGLPAVDQRALEHLLMRVSEMACELPSLVELDLNPVLATSSGVMAVDVRARVARQPPLLARYAHMAVHPYPSELVHEWQLVDGTAITLRPIRPEDAAIEADFVRSLSDASRYYRFMSPVRELTPEMLVRFTQLDYSREMALIATVQVSGQPEEIGVARYFTNPDGRCCEFAVVVADSWQRRGVGAALMEHLLGVAVDRGLERMQGDVMRDNHEMRAFVKRLGFEEYPSDDDHEIVRVVKSLEV